MSPSEAQAAEALQARYSGPLRDLKALVNLLLPGTRLTGVAAE